LLTEYGPSIGMAWKPPMEETNTAEPPPRACIRGAHAWGPDFTPHRISDIRYRISDIRFSTSDFSSLRKDLEEQEGGLDVDIKNLVPGLAGG
jgi:hypothetical protein